jgi:uncharacterized membrane protein YkvA (DUF1232 family)
MSNPLIRMLDMARHAVDVFLARETPLSVKVVLGLGLLYILSPYDLIPEWMPVVGVLDDLALAALLIGWASRFRLPNEN